MSPFHSVRFSRDVFISQVKPKKVYKFTNKKLSSTVPHFHIVLNIENELLILAVCTSKFEKRKSFIEKNLLPLSTLVYIKGDFLSKETFVDCNHNIFTENSIDTLYDYYKNGILEFSGEITDQEYIQILDGIIDSPLTTKLLKNKIQTIKKVFLTT